MKTKQLFTLTTILIFLLANFNFVLATGEENATSTGIVQQDCRENPTACFGGWTCNRQTGRCDPPPPQAAGGQSGEGGNDAAQQLAQQLMKQLEDMMQKARQMGQQPTTQDGAQASSGAECVKVTEPQKQAICGIARSCGFCACRRIIDQLDQLHQKCEESKKQCEQNCEPQRCKQNDAPQGCPNNPPGSCTKYQSPETVKCSSQGQQATPEEGQQTTCEGAYGLTDLSLVVSGTKYDANQEATANSNSECISKKNEVKQKCIGEVIQKYTADVQAIILRATADKQQVVSGYFSRAAPNEIGDFRVDIGEGNPLQDGCSAFRPQSREEAEHLLNRNPELSGKLPESRVRYWAGLGVEMRGQEQINQGVSSAGRTPSQPASSPEAAATQRTPSATTPPQEATSTATAPPEAVGGPPTSTRTPPTAYRSPITDRNGGSRPSGLGRRLGETVEREVFGGVGDFIRDLVKRILEQLVGGDREGSGGGQAAPPPPPPAVREETGAALVRPSSAHPCDLQYSTEACGRLGLNEAECQRRRAACYRTTYATGGAVANLITGNAVADYTNLQNDIISMNSPTGVFECPDYHPGCGIRTGQTVVFPQDLDGPVVYDSNGVPFNQMSSGHQLWLAGDRVASTPNYVEAFGNSLLHIKTAGEELMLGASLYSLIRNGDYFVDLRARPIEKFKILEGAIASPFDAVHKYLEPVSVNVNDVSDPVIPNSVHIGLLQNVKRISGNGNSNVFLHSANDVQQGVVFPMGYRNDYAVGRTLIINWGYSSTFDTYQIKDGKGNVYYIQNGLVIDSNGKIIEDTMPPPLNEVQVAKIYGTVQ